MPWKKVNVALYIDHENIRQTMIRVFGTHPDPRSLGTTLREVAEKEGRLIVQNVYGDWRLYHGSHPDGKSKIEAKPLLIKAGLSPVDVPVKGSGPDTRDRTDIFLAIDASFDVFQKKDIKTVVIASSDGDYCPMIQKMKGEGKQVVVVGFKVAMGDQLSIVADKPVYLEKVLGLAIPADPGVDAPASTYEWPVFIEAMFKAENQRWAFVGLKKFRDSWMNPSMGVKNVQDKHEMINYAIREAIVVKSLEVNPNSPYPTTAIKLNHDHPLVRDSLKR